ncbi:MAG: hypothetical protein J5601_06350 [Elusimicrobiaceae bacterium]|nr:hypothetical protein [Elusimicrobiaceae bacterium]
MKKILFLLLLAVMSCLPGLSMSKARNVDVKENPGQVTANLVPQSPKEEKNTGASSFDPEQVIKALDEVRFKENENGDLLINNDITYSDFMKENEQLNTSLQTFFSGSMDSDLQTFLSESTDSDTASKVKIFGIEGRPDYGEAAKSARFIYLSETTGHGKKTVVNEVKRILHSVREKNPQAKILLAIEFAETANLSLPIQFANTLNQDIEWPTPYSQLLEETDKLDIDTLALDDFFVGRETESGNLWYKMGQSFVLLNKEDHPAFIENPVNITKEELLSLGGVLCGSRFGVQLRNEQWVSYINAMKSYYDIVIVYAGSAHLLSLPNMPGVPEKVNEKYIFFSIYSSERKPPYQRDHEREARKLRQEEHNEIDEWKTFVELTMGINPQWNGENVMYLEVESPRISADEHIQSLSASFERTFPLVYQEKRVKFFEVLLPDESGNN